MNPEIGLLSLILAFCIALIQGVLPLVGSYCKKSNWMSLSAPLAYGHFLFIFVSFLSLMVAFIGDDFSVAYVANNSNSMLPIYYKITAVWGGHEGSLLLWILILSGWGVTVAIFSRQLPFILRTRVLSILGLISVGFLLFILMTSNPFDRLLPFGPQDGADLNPLLQDFGMIIHPPMLYMGYVGFSVAFAFAIAALLEGNMDISWARWVRPWTTSAWSFLTIGIALGSWWAYYELGWGGWWFWDPVENASLMPWLVGTALMHSLIVTEKRGLFKSWTALLAIATFSLSLLGTFLVRSGVLTSVHAFANDPQRGVFILIYLFLVVGSSLLLFAFKAPEVRNRISFSWLSRETWLLLNNILLTIAAATVLIGTLFPLVLDTLDMGKVSVGPPYFNMLIVPMAMLLAFAMGIGILLNWKKNLLSWLIKEIRWITIASILGSLLLIFLYAKEFLFAEFLSVTLVLWVLLVIGKDIIKKTRHKGFIAGLKALKPSYYGMQLGHLGFVVLFLGIAITSGYSVQKDVRMSLSDTVQLNGYVFQFQGIRKVQGANYQADRAIVNVYQNQKKIAIMHPEKRTYEATKMVMTEADIKPLLFKDLYVALGENLKDGSWSMRLHVKPMVRWIWVGCILMALGGFIAIADSRYRKKNAIKLNTTCQES